MSKNTRSASLSLDHQLNGFFNIFKTLLLLSYSNLIWSSFLWSTVKPEWGHYTTYPPFSRVAEGREISFNFLNQVLCLITLIIPYYQFITSLYKSEHADTISMTLPPNLTIILWTFFKPCDYYNILRTIIIKYSWLPV